MHRIAHLIYYDLIVVYIHYNNNTLDNQYDTQQQIYNYLLSVMIQGSLVVRIVLHQ